MPTCGPSKTYGVDFKGKTARKFFCAVSVSIEIDRLSIPIFGGPHGSHRDPRKYRHEAHSTVRSAMRSAIAASSKRQSSIRRPDNHITQPPSERLSQERQSVAEKRVMVRLVCVDRSSAISCGERKPCWFDGWKPHRRWRPYSSVADCIAQCVQEFGPRLLLDREPAEIRTRMTRRR